MLFDQTHMMSVTDLDVETPWIDREYSLEKEFTTLIRVNL